MKDQITTACRNVNRKTLLSVHQSFIKRINKCLKVQGHHFERLFWRFCNKKLYCIVTKIIV